jgi:hypothetical protein
MQPGIFSQLLMSVGLAAAILLLFGIWYNHKVEQLERAGHQEGYVSLLVAAGVGTVLVAAAAVVWPLGVQALAGVLIVCLLFVPAGIPMMLGSIRRHVAQREREQETLRAHARDLTED